MNNTLELLQGKAKKMLQLENRTFYARLNFLAYSKW